jgi:hypothetical protein
MSNDLMFRDGTIPTNVSNYNTEILEEETQRNNLIDKVNQKELDELTKLQNNYKGIMNDILLLQKEINDEQDILLNRVSPRNEYLNKNITLNNSGGVLPVKGVGYGGYVTSRGIFKSYPNNDVYNKTIGKNGCPSRQTRINNVTLNSYSGSLQQGSDMVEGQSCGNEGQNIYTTKLVNNIQSTYIGCYNDTNTPMITNIVPKMTSSNKVDGFTANASSVYKNNNNYGPWCAFDQNKNTFWHCTTSLYDGNTGNYNGKISLNINTIKSGLKQISGEYLQINMPSSLKLTSYDIQGRQDCCGTPNGRSPNTWYIIGYKDGQWYEVDYRQNQNYDKELKNYLISNPNSYNSYAIIITVVGNSSAPKGTRSSVQISVWNLYSTNINSNEENAMMLNENYTSFNNCQSYALENGYKYFGMRNLQSNGLANCLVSNDLTQIKMYGNGTKQFTALPLWSSNTSDKGITTLQLLGTGELVLTDITNNIIARINKEQANCNNSGKITIQTATYGGNCSKSNVEIGNVTNIVANNLKCDKNINCSIPISNGTFGDPAKGCRKNFDITYKCGGKSFSKNSAPAEGKTMILDCKDYINKTCTFFLFLQDNGNICIYKGTDPSNILDRNAIWCSNTRNKQQQANNDWKASKGKFGRNYMKMGESLAIGEWIGSNNGNLKLQMETNGNLIIYTTILKQGCIKNNNKIYGSTDNVNAVYELNNLGNINSLGKVAYIDDDSNLREYPQSMLGKSSEYILYPNFDSDGNTIKSVNVNQLNDCITECNNNELCNGFSYQNDVNMCYLKDDNMFPNSSRQYNNNFILGLRKPKVITNDTCNKNIIEVDTIKYDNYVKGNMMTSSTECGESVLNKEKKERLTKLNSELSELGNIIANKMMLMFSKDNKIHEKMNKNSSEFQQDIEEYKNTIKKLEEYKQENSLNIIEGMQTIRTMNDINGMLKNSDITVLQENYNYLLWSIAALGLMTITVNIIKK